MNYHHACSLVVGLCKSTEASCTVRDNLCPNRLFFPSSFCCMVSSEYLVITAITKDHDNMKTLTVRFLEHPHTTHQLLLASIIDYKTDQSSYGCLL